MMSVATAFERVISRSGLPVFKGDLAPVREHYREMLTELLRLAPEIDHLLVFTNDSGAGFCYSRNLYAGPNGPRHCLGVTVSERVLGFLETLRDAGRRFNPQFRVVLTQAVDGEERADLIGGLTPGLYATVYGALAWQGGLEERWGSMALGSAMKDSALRDSQRRWQRQDFLDRVEPLTRRGIEIYVDYEVEFFSLPGHPPRPLEVLSILRTLRQVGARNIVGGPSVDELNVNSEVFRRFQHNPEASDETLMGAIARDWVGPEQAGVLREVWSILDAVDRTRPIPAPNGHSFLYDCFLGLSEAMPIVPDFSRLAPAEKQFYQRDYSEDLWASWRMQGGVYTEAWIRWGGFDDAFCEKLRARAGVMQAHRDDPVARVHLTGYSHPAPARQST